MSKISQAQKVIEFLKTQPKKNFTAQEIAKVIVKKYPNDYDEKRKNARFKNEESFINQVAAEIGSGKKQIKKGESHVFWQDKPRPRIYWYDPDKNADEETPGRDGDNVSLTEHELYPKLIDYLKTELHLYCQRIDEKTSKNSKGSGGNRWLHPDIVAMQPIDEKWSDLIKNCIKQGAGQRVRLCSFEVKKELKRGNVRESFFQAVTNSSWANEGYLVAASIPNDVEEELRMLSSLHGIGVILLNSDNPTESDMIFPAKSRTAVDWQSVNRLLEENKDFEKYIELVSTYYETGRFKEEDWNKIK